MLKSFNGFKGEAWGHPVQRVWNLRCPRLDSAQEGSCFLASINVVYG